MFYAYLLLGACLLPLVSASVYPTQPVQATVWSADRSMLINWIEDWKFPLLSEMGPLDISLWRDADTFVVQLASAVDPMAKMRQVTVPGWALKQGSKYTLRFMTSKPIDVAIFSADFVILGENATSPTTGSVIVTSVAGTGTGTDTAAKPGVTTGSGTGTMPTTAGSISTSTATASRYGSTAPSGTPPSSGTLQGGVPGEAQRAASAGRRSVDVEKLKFRFVFVIWPVLMGISMAL